MPGVGVGGLVSNLFSPGLDQTIAKQITPDPSPLAQQGQGQDGKGAGAPQGEPAGNAYARAAVTQQDPVVASLAENLVKAQRMSMLSADLNRNLAGVAAGFGTAQQQASKQAALAGMPGGADEMGMWKNIQDIQQANVDQNEHARFMANMRVLAKVLGLPDTPDGVAQATEIANNKGMLEQQGQAAATNKTDTQTIKDANAATAAWQQANPNATPQEAAAYKSSIIAMGSGGGNMEDMAYRNYAQDEISHGRVPDNIVVWKGKQGSEVKSIVDINQTKLDAKQSWPQVQSVWNEHLKTIDWLHDPAHHAAVVAAIQRPDILTEGNWGNVFKILGVTSQEVADAKAQLDQYRDQLTAEKFTGSKNVRSNFEAKFLGGSASHLFKKTNSDGAITGELDRLYDESHTRYANVAAASGAEVPYDQADKVDKSLLDSTNPLFNGATVQKPPKQEDGGAGGGPVPTNQPSPSATWPKPEDWQVQLLRDNPDRAAEFDKKFGPGASKRVLGR